MRYDPAFRGRGLEEATKENGSLLTFSPFISSSQFMDVFTFLASAAEPNKQCIVMYEGIADVFVLVYEQSCFETFFSARS